MICIFTDGAYSSKTLNGGWGYQAVNSKKVEENLTVRSGAKESTTNNEMELTAFYEALKWIGNIEIKEPVTIYSDSAYIVNCFQDKWYEKWRTNDWKTANHTPVKHKELWIKILDIIDKLRNDKTGNGLELYIMKVDAHTGDDGNEAADQLAVKAREELANKKG